jgi:hypothetical protein
MVAEPGQLEQLGERTEGVGVGIQILEKAGQVLERRFEGAPRETAHRQQAFHRRVGPDHGLARLALVAYVLQTVVDDSREGLGKPGPLRRHDVPHPGRPGDARSRYRCEYGRGHELDPGEVQRSAGAATRPAWVRRWVRCAGGNRGDRLDVGGQARGTDDPEYEDQPGQDEERQDRGQELPGPVNGRRLMRVVVKLIAALAPSPRPEDVEDHAQHDQIGDHGEKDRRMDNADCSGRRGAGRPACERRRPAGDGEQRHEDGDEQSKTDQSHAQDRRSPESGRRSKPDRLTGARSRCGDCRDAIRAVLRASHHKNSYSPQR